MKRRNFLKTAALIAADSFISHDVMAADYRKANDGSYEKKYIYNPFEGNTQKEVIENNILPVEQSEQKGFWNQPRNLVVKRIDTNEQANINYFLDNKVNMEGYKVASYLMRDIHQNQMIGIDLKLLDLMCAIQAWLIYYGVKSPLLIHSGFRTSKTNKGLEGAAKNSMHLYGRAVDFSLPNVNPNILAKIAAQFKAGGIGIYNSQNFIHLDTGGVRMWVR